MVNDDFPIQADGIIGVDFLRKYKCILGYQDNEDFIVLRPRNLDYEITTPLLSGPTINSISIPARSEVIRSIKFESLDNEVLVPQQTIQDGVYIANTITTKQKPLVKIINTTENDLTISNIHIVTEKLSNYKIITTETNPKKRKEKLEILSKNFPKIAEKDLKVLCTEFIDVFALESEKISANNFYKQKLRLHDKEPVYIKNYRIPHAQKEEVNKQIDKLIKDDIIEPSISEYNSPILLVPKKPLPDTTQKRWRLVVDYRGLNKKLIADKFPLPRIDDILDQLGRAKYFSCLDLVSGFHQIELEEKSRDLTTFSTEKGSYKFKRLPYGLKIAPNSFQRMMSLAFSGLSPAQAFVYMDDLIVIGCSSEHMLRNLRDVFNTCRKYNLKLHPEKCSFFCNEVTFLGHKCTDKGILPDDNKFTAIKNYPTPKNGDEAKRFIAFCNYYRRFIPNFAEISRHITKLSRKNTPFVWTETCNEAFQYLKEQLLSPRILQYPDFSKEFFITTDASKNACGAVLSQEKDGIQLPISYASRTFTKGESNKSTIEQELTAIHWAIQYFRPYVYGRKFVVKSDHRPLSYLFSLKNPSSKLTRIRLDLEEYDFAVEYIRGKENHIADALSRIEIKDIQNIEVNNILKVTTRLQARNKKVESRETNKPQLETSEYINIYEAINAQEYCKIPQLYFTHDKFIICKGKKKLCESQLHDMIINGKVDLGHLFPKLEKIANNLGLTTLRLSLDDRQFYYLGTNIGTFKNKGNEILQDSNTKLTIVLTPKIEKIKTDDKKLEIMRKYHNDPLIGGHPGITRMIKKIRLHYHWKGMTRDITKFVKTCKTCQMNKPANKIKESFVITPTPAKAFDIVIIDTIGPLPRSESENEYAVTIMCDLTKYLVAIPVPNKSAKFIAKAIMENFILTYGPMTKILTDMGTEYMNQILTELCLMMKIEKLNSTPYHHETLGTVERSHRTFNEYLRTYISSDKSDWDTWLKYFVYCYNTTPSTAHDYCPFELIYGKIPPSLECTSKDVIDPLYNIDSYEKEVKFRLQIAQRRAAKFIETSKLNRQKYSNERANSIQIALNDLVLVQNEAGHKLEPIYKGPYSVVSIDERNNVTLAGDDGKTFKVHKNRLKRYNANTQTECFSA